ncbi:hypothetical protein [Croceivirga thetidis]|uniref:Uncharacterized protein n=1 Tax=Croceivirga thetidis TaxID=2721623 RepID=A0ABX1GSZ6_9FLAO|nr:hypothetical protein [Croceivirga thetidis]NKI33082.1 hypothetical protein [Croceivirga thetidis]
MKLKQLGGVALGAFASFLVIIACQEDSEDLNQDAEQGAIEAPAKLISFSAAQNMHNNYMVNRASVIEKYEREVNQKDDFVAIQYSEWDLETIEEYIAYVKQEANAANVNVNTLRFYFGQYDQSQDGKSNLFIVPTTDFDGVNLGFYIDGSGAASPLKGKGDTSSKNGGSLILNYSQGGPPPPDDF